MEFAISFCVDYLCPVTGSRGCRVAYVRRGEAGAAPHWAQMVPGSSKWLQPSSPQGTVTD